jgi:hypothetical protein
MRLWWFVLSVGCSAEQAVSSSDSVGLTGDSPVYFGGDSGLFEDMDGSPGEPGSGGSGESLPVVLGEVLTESADGAVERGILAYADSSGIHVTHQGIQAPCEQVWEPSATVAEYVIAVDYMIGSGTMCMHHVSYSLDPIGIGLAHGVYLLRAVEDQVSVEISDSYE